MAANDFTSFIIRYSNSTKSSVLVTTALGGAIASLMRVALMPIDTCKTVLQVDGSQGFQRLVKRVGVVVFSNCYNTLGVRGSYFEPIPRDCCHLNFNIRWTLSLVYLYSSLYFWMIASGT